MTSVRNFEELETWKAARSLVSVVYRLTDDVRFNQEWDLKRQLRRAAVSVPSNIAEGFERDGKRELMQFLYVAKGSAGEVRTQLIIAADVGLISSNSAEPAIGLARRVGQLLGGLAKAVRENNLEGLRYRPPETRNPKRET